VPGDQERSWLGNAIKSFVRHHIEASDERRLRQLRAGADVDEHGLPFGTIPGAFIDARDEARLVFPHAHQVFRKVDRGAGSALAMMLSLDSPPTARVAAGYLAPATSTAVLAWYRTELRTRGWEERRLSRPTTARSAAIEVFHRGREWVSVTVPNRQEAQAILDRSGFGRSLADGETVYGLDYQIGVQQRPRRQNGT
jgi:hypothetical protein